MDVNIIKRKLLIKYPFFGAILAYASFIPDGNIKTACTDGKDIFYNPNFMNSLSLQEQLFVFAHEVCHIAFNHILRSEGKKMKLWNIATDAVINALLHKDRFPLLEGAIDKPEALYYDAEQMYQKLLEEENEKETPETGESLNDQDMQQTSETDVGHDSHSMWEKVIEKKKEQKEVSKEEKQLDDKVKEISEMGERKAFQQNEIIKKKLMEEFCQPVHRKVSSESGGCIDHIGVSAPLIDWRRLLKEAVQYEVDWSYRNATLEDGVLTPYLEEMPMPETEILLDTSGSISETLLKNFLRECKNIVQTSKVKVGCFDDAFYGFTEIKNEKDIDHMIFQGRGGTDFDVAVNAFTRRVENKIIFTDGEARMPSKSLDAIWIVFGGRKIQPKGGKVIYITDQQLRTLLYETDYDVEVPYKSR